MGLGFLYPLFLLGAAAIAIPIALHLFRRRTETVVEFPAVRLLDNAPATQQRRRKLRELILLALRVTALVLLAFAFARPYLSASIGAVPAPITVVALDTSLSLSAPGQFDAARQAARAAVQNAPATHTVGLLTFADTASLVVPPTASRGAVLSAIDAAKPGASGTRFRTALARAAETIGATQGRIVVITDLQQVGWEAGDEGAVPDGIAVEIVAIASPQGNIAVTAVRRDGSAVIAALHNFGTRAAKARVRLFVEGKELSSQPIDIPAQTAAEARLVGALPLRGSAEVRVDDPEGYQFDNTRFLVLDPPGAVPLFVITADPPGSSNAGLYVERALGVADDGRAFQTRVIDGRTFSALTTAQFGDPAGLIVLGTRTLDRTGRERIAAFLRGGGRVLLTLGPDTDLLTLGDTVGTDLGVDQKGVETAAQTVTLVAVDGRHPIFRPFLSPTGAFGDVYIERYLRLSDQRGRTVLARFSGAGSAMTEQTVERGRLLVFASDLDNRWNRFPLNPAFVPWAVETARYLTQGRENRQSWTLPDIPPGARFEPGVQRVGERPVAINVDVRESNPARTSIEEFTNAITRLNEVAEVRTLAAAREQEEQQRLWQFGLLVMFLALAAEGVIGRKAT
jgi:hypothetical protein